MKLVLASTSPRRRELLSRLGVEFEVEPPTVNEDRHPGEAPPEAVERLARAKATAVAGPGKIVLAADTLVVHDGRALGKPAHPEEARSMLRDLQGSSHDVFTGIAVAHWDGHAVVESMVDVAEVVFLPMTADEIASYVATGEPMDKAGSYALQGIAGRYVEAVHGSPFTVIGLPLHLLARLVARAGHDLEAFAVDPQSTVDSGP
ncbi:MAG: Maf family protein [Acidimicrobiia bacterium]|nr:Maf family protein [Acidimicrobiia bacterium]